MKDVAIYTFALPYIALIQSYVEQHTGISLRRAQALEYAINHYNPSAADDATLRLFHIQRILQGNVLAHFHVPEPAYDTITAITKRYPGLRDKALITSIAVTAVALSLKQQ